FPATGRTQTRCGLFSIIEQARQLPNTPKLFAQPICPPHSTLPLFRQTYAFAVEKAVDFRKTVSQISHIFVKLCKFSLVRRFASLVRRFLLGELCLQFATLCEKFVHLQPI